MRVVDVPHQVVSEREFLCFLK
jgi:hypothetical protein